MTQKRKLESIDSFRFKDIPLIDNANSVLSDFASSRNKSALRITMDATHSGRLTNLRVYPGKEVIKATDSFLKPYPKPVLKAHDSEKDPIGRVEAAEFIQLAQGDAFNKDYLNPGENEGSGFVRLTTLINDQDSIEKFLDGRFLSVSTRQTLGGLYCSICGEDFRDFGTECDHFPGKSYKIKNKETDTIKEYLCYGIADKLSYHEVSVVNIPGDDYAKVSKIEELRDAKDDSFVFYSPSNEMLTLADMAIVNGEDIVSLLKDPSKPAPKAPVLITISPKFKDNLISKDKPMEKTEQVKEPEAKIEASKSNTADEKTSSESGTSKTDTVDSTKEGVIAPKAETKEGSGNEEKVASATEADRSAEIVRLKASLAEKNEELTRVRKSLTDSQLETKTAYSVALLNARMYLGKSDVSHVKDEDTQKKQLEKYSERTIESLKDAIEDLAVELRSHKVSNLVSSKTILEKPKLDNRPQVGPSRDQVGPKEDTKDTKKDLKSRKRQKIANFSQYLDQ